MDEFRQKVIEHARKMTVVAAQCKSEQSVNMFLVLPFIELLGYDGRNPLEVSPEHHADFSEKYKNRVDFAILKEGVPTIAVESKQCGAVSKDDRGQLRSYFNACKTVKMGVLTDGLIFEFFADSDEPNMMDQTAFLAVDLNIIASGHIEDSVIDGLRALQKVNFDPESIGAEAKRKHIFHNILGQLDEMAENPSEAFTRMVLQNAGMTHLRSKTIEEYQPLLQEAFKEFINHHILKRLSLEPEDKVMAVPIEKASAEPVETKVIITPLERKLFSYVRQRLAFLVKDETLYAGISEIEYRDYQGKFVIFFRKERKGRLLDFIENADGSMRVMFADGPDRIISDFSEIDEPLLAIYARRFGEDTRIAA